MKFRDNLFSLLVPGLLPLLHLSNFGLLRLDDVLSQLLDLRSLGFAQGILRHRDCTIVVRNHRVQKP